MIWKYLLVFFGAMLFDLVPFPFLPAYTIMALLQIVYNLDVWWVIVTGVLGSLLGRYILYLYAPVLSKKYLKSSKNEDIEFLGSKMKENIWKGQLFILAYSLLPVPSTPLFIGAGISKIQIRYVIPWFIIGKLINDTLAVHLGKFDAKNTDDIIENILSWKSLTTILLGVILIFALFSINWRMLIQKNKLELNFKIWK